MNQYGMMTDEDVPQAEWASGTTKDAGKAPPPVSNLTSASYKTQQTGSVLDSFEGTGVVSAFDPRTNATVSPYQLATMKPEEREGIVLTFPDKPQVTIAQARALGWTPTTGPFADRAAAPGGQPQEEQQPEPQQEPEEHPDLQMEAFDNGGEADQLHDSYVEGTSPGDQVRALTEIVDKGELSEATFITLASQMGLQRDEAEAKATKIMDAYAKQATAAIADVVPFVDAETFSAWAWENHPTKFAEVQKKHAMQRNTQGYKELAKSYLETMDEHSPQELLGANFGEGVTARRDGKHIIIDIPGKGSFTWKSLVKAGFVGKPQRKA